MGQLLVEFAGQAAEPDPDKRQGVGPVRRGLAVEEPVEAVLVHAVDAPGVAVLVEAGEARVGGRV